MYLIVLSKEEETIRLRAHALLMRQHGLHLADIAGLVFRSEWTITRWFKEFVGRRLSSIFSDQLENEHASKLTRD